MTDRDVFFFVYTYSLPTTGVDTHDVFNPTTRTLVLFCLFVFLLFFLNSQAIGHPFGATGSRITTTAANRLQREDGKYAIVAACADSGLAYGGLIERA